MLLLAIVGPRQRLLGEHNGGPRHAHATLGVGGRRSRFDWCLWVLILFKLAYLREVRQEVGPHDVMLNTKKSGDIKRSYLVDVGALHLSHLNVVFTQKTAVVSARSADFIQTLVGVEGELFPLVLQLLRVFTQHEPERLLFVTEHFSLSAHQLVHGPSGELPLGGVLVLE